MHAAHDGRLSGVVAMTAPVAGLIAVMKPSGRNEQDRARAVQHRSTASTTGVGSGSRPVDQPGGRVDAVDFGAGRVDLGRGRIIKQRIDVAPRGCSGQRHRELQRGHVHVDDVDEAQRREHAGRAVRSEIRARDVRAQRSDRGVLDVRRFVDEVNCAFGRIHGRERGGRTGGRDFDEIDVLGREFLDRDELRAVRHDRRLERRGIARGGEGGVERRTGDRIDRLALHLEVRRVARHGRGACAAAETRTGESDNEEEQKR
jgi:hypothetical protein